MFNTSIITECEKENIKVIKKIFSMLHDTQLVNKLSCSIANHSIFIFMYAFTISMPAKFVTFKSFVFTIIQSVSQLVNHINAYAGHKTYQQNRQ